MQTSNVLEYEAYDQTPSIHIKELSDTYLEDFAYMFEAIQQAFSLLVIAASKSTRWQVLIETLLTNKILLLPHLFIKVL